MANTIDKQLDAIGWRILAELQANARISYAELGRRVGLTTPAVSERVRRLEESGVIAGYRTEVDPAKVGLPITAFIRMSIVGDVSNALVALVRELPEVVECHKGTGGDSFILKVTVRSVAHLEALIDRLIPFGTTSTSIVLSSPVERRTIEREDIESLGNALYRIPKTVEKFAERYALAGERIHGVDFVQRARMLVDAAEVVVKMVSELRKMQLESMKSLSDRLRAIEVEADRLMLELYRELYAGKYDPIQTFMVHDFYEILEKAIDRCREAGVVAYQIVLKNS